jgi:hypothetical protein
MELITTKTIEVEGTKVVLYWTGRAEGDGVVWTTDRDDAGIHEGGMFEQVDGIQDISRYAESYEIVKESTEEMLQWLERAYSFNINGEDNFVDYYEYEVGYDDKEEFLSQDVLSLDDGTCFTLGDVVSARWVIPRQALSITKEGKVYHFVLVEHVKANTEKEQ